MSTSQLSLREQIAEVERNIRSNEDTIRLQRAVLKSLYEQRRQCNHVFSQPLKGYEHEGGTCELCGINEIEAAHQQRT